MPVPDRAGAGRTAYAAVRTVADLWEPVTTWWKPSVAAAEKALEDAAG